MGTRALMIDSHCHLAGPEFAADLPEVVARAKAAGVSSALTILAAGDAQEAAQARRLSELWPEVRFSVGVHPHQAKDFADRLPEVPSLLDAAIRVNDRVRAVGEIGLDYHYGFSPPDVQQAVFRRQVEYARDRDLPIVVHAREATEDTFAILREAGGGEVRGVFHCFTGGEAMARAALDIGFHLSFAGIITFPKAPELRAIAAWVPDDRFLIETDSPYLAPVPHRGARNEPAYVLRVAETIAAERGVSSGEIAARVHDNFLQLFRP